MEWNMLKPERELRNGFKLAKPRNSINNIYQVNLFSRQSLRRLTLIYRIKGSKNTKEYSKNDNYVWTLNMTSQQKGQTLSTTSLQKGHTPIQWGRSNIHSDVNIRSNENKHKSCAKFALRKKSMPLSTLNNTIQEPRLDRWIFSL